MKKTLLKGAYKPPEVEVLYVNVERGYGASGGSGGGGGGATDDPLYDGGSTTPDMPIEPL